MPDNIQRNSSYDNLIPLLTDSELSTFIDLIYDECGIHLKPEKRSMLSARLGKRLKALGLQSFQDYLRYLDDANLRIRELVSLVDAVTTNKTDFFREDNHFAFLTQKALPDIVKTRHFQKDGHLQFWSAGCSTGEEPYTLAMVLEDFFSQRPGDYSILATDIAIKVLKKARQAVYPEALIAPIPKPFRKKYLMAGKGHQLGHYRVVPELRKKITFGRLNFMDPDYNLGMKMDAIFCRNVIIYFDYVTKSKVIKKLYHYLKPGGYLFVGHSETLSGIDVDLERIVPTIFRKTGI